MEVTIVPKLELEFSRTSLGCIYFSRNGEWGPIYHPDGRAFKLPVANEHTAPPVPANFIVVFSHYSNARVLDSYFELLAPMYNMPAGTRLRFAV